MYHSVYMDQVNCARTSVKVGPSVSWGSTSIVTDNYSMGVCEDLTLKNYKATEQSKANLKKKRLFAVSQNHDKIQVVSWGEVTFESRPRYKKTVRGQAAVNRFGTITKFKLNIAYA